MNIVAPKDPAFNVEFIGITFAQPFMVAALFPKVSRDSDPMRSEQALLLIQQLYAVEREAREQNLNHEQRYQLRQEKSVTVPEHTVNRLHELLPPNWKPAKLNITAES